MAFREVKKKNVISETYSLVENMFYEDEYYFELTIYSNYEELNFFQDQTLSKVIFVYSDGNGNITHTVITGCEKKPIEDFDLNIPPKYIKTIENKDGQVVCVLKIFHESDFFVGKRLIFVYLETVDRNFFTIQFNS